MACRHHFDLFSSVMAMHIIFPQTQTQICSTIGHNYYARIFIFCLVGQIFLNLINMRIFGDFSSLTTFDCEYSKKGKMQRAIDRVINKNKREKNPTKNGRNLVYSNDATPTKNHMTLPRITQKTQGEKERERNRTKNYCEQHAVIYRVTCWILIGYDFQHILLSLVCLCVCLPGDFSIFLFLSFSCIWKFKHRG